MKKFFHFIFLPLQKKIFFLVCFCFFSPLSFTQEIEIESEAEIKELQTPFFDFFNENLSGIFVGSESFGAYGSRSNYSLQLQYSKELKNRTKFLVTINSFYNRVNLHLKLRERYRKGRIR